MKKKITDERRKHLLMLLELVGEQIAIKEEYCICKGMDFVLIHLKDRITNSVNWMKLPEAMMIKPNCLTDDVIPNTFNYYSFWWGKMTMGSDFKTNTDVHSHEARQARLLGIAMMLTLPDDMINEEFLIESKTDNNENTEI